jgi:hypothetical protein
MAANKELLCMGRKMQRYSELSTDFMGTMRGKADPSGLFVLYSDVAPECPNCGRSDGWHKADGHPPPPGDCRKIVWLETPDGMAYWGVRAYGYVGVDGHDVVWGWHSNGRAESDVVTFWMEGPHNPYYPLPEEVPHD